MMNIAVPARIAWELLWRSTVLFPFFFLLSALAFGVWIARFILPFCIPAFALAHDWIGVGLCALGWVVAVAMGKWRPLRNMFEPPPSLL